MQAKTGTEATLIGWYTGSLCIDVVSPVNKGNIMDDLPGRLGITIKYRTNRILFRLVTLSQ